MQIKPSQLREIFFYLKSSIFAAVIFALCYTYLRWMNIPGEVNKSLADTSIILIGWSMLLTSVCYFWNVVDWSIIYRKYLGLVGFAFAIAHLLFSWGAFTSLFDAAQWQKGSIWPAFMGVVALVIFAIMTLISNTYAVRKIGFVNWKRVLRTGYIAMFFVLLHVVLLKSPRWITWFTSGMKTLPSLSLIVTVFMITVFVSRLMMWWSLRKAAGSRR